VKKYTTHIEQQRIQNPNLGTDQLVPLEICKLLMEERKKTNFRINDPFLQSKGKLTDYCIFKHTHDAASRYATQFLNFIGGLEMKMLLDSSFLYASRYGHTEVVQSFLHSSIVDPAILNNQALVCASGEGHSEVVCALLKDTRVNPADSDNRAIINASGGGHIEVVRLLLGDKRVNPGAEANKSILLASLHGHAEVVQALLKHKKVDPAVLYNP
jgi:hypothetical protein